MKTTITVLMMCLMTIALSAQNLTAFESIAKWGYKNSSGKVVIPAKYDYAEDFSEGFAAVGLQNLGGRITMGFINTVGKAITPMKYEYVEKFSEGLALVKLNDKYGFIDKTGKEFIPLKYDSAESFENGKALVELNGDYYDIDKTGERIE